MKHRSIRLRLTAWYCAVLAGALVLFGGAMWLAVRHSFIAEVDKTLQQHVHGAVALIQMERAENASVNEIRDELAEYVKAVPQGSLMHIHDGRGTTLLVANAPEDPRAEYRRHSETTIARDQTYSIYAAAPLQEVNGALQRFGVLLIASIPIVVLIASIGGYWISRRALAPVDEITAAARTITIRNLSQRLRVSQTGDEIQRLSETWNETLERLEAAVNRLSQFTADASHELRTPIALIRTEAEIALRRERSPEVYREALRQIRNESERTTQLIEDLLTLARADAGLQSLPLNPLELGELIQYVSASWQVMAENRGIRLESEAARAKTIIEGNAPALQRMFGALIDNALKYTPPGGVVRIGVAANGGGAIVTVRDTGVGIRETALPHIFERFYRADEARNHEGGSGLGLSIAQWIAQRHHARIAAESKLGAGSVFSVIFNHASISAGQHTACENERKVLSGSQPTNL